jgi:hypothetical protein
MIRIHINATPEVMERLRTQGPQIIERLTTKMTLLMFKLQAKIVGETIPSMFKPGTGNLAKSVRAIPAEVDGTIIRGTVEAGGPTTTKTNLHSGAAIDYAGVQEYGVAHSYQILPFNKRALRFFLDGKQMIVRSVTHPGLRARPFMRQSLEQMQEQIIAELNQEVTGLLS